MNMFLKKCTYSLRKPDLSNIKLYFFRNLYNKSNN